MVLCCKSKSVKNKESRQAEGYQMATSTTPQEASAYLAIGSTTIVPPPTGDKLIKNLAETLKLVEVTMKRSSDLWQELKRLHTLLRQKHDFKDSLTPAQCLQIFHKVHVVAREFTSACRAWLPGNALPEAGLHFLTAGIQDGRVHTYDTCPVDVYLPPIHPTGDRQQEEPPTSQQQRGTKRGWWETSGTPP